MNSGTDFGAFPQPQSPGARADLARLHGRDDRGVDEGFGPLGRVLDQALPLPRQPHKLLLLLVEVGVHAVLEVGGRRDLDTLLLLFTEHGDGRASDLRRGERAALHARALHHNIRQLLLTRPRQELHSVQLGLKQHYKKRSNL